MVATYAELETYCKTQEVDMFSGTLQYFYQRSGRSPLSLTGSHCTMGILIEGIYKSLGKTPAKFVPIKDREAFLKKHAEEFEQCVSSVAKGLLKDCEYRVPPKSSYEVVADAARDFFIREEWLLYTSKDKAVTEQINSLLEKYIDLYDRQRTKVLTGNSVNPIAEYKKLKEEVMDDFKRTIKDAVEQVKTKYVG